MKVIKRDGSVQEFDIKKIEAAILAAMIEVNGEDTDNKNDVYFAAISVSSKLSGLPLYKPISIETIQDAVEEALMRELPQVAKAFILYRDKHTELRVLSPDKLAVADYIHASKYAKYLPAKKRRETYKETVYRSQGMHIDRNPQLATEINDAFAYVHKKKVLPSMRSMQFGGPAIIAHNARMYNCAYTLIDRPRVFQEILYLLLCGCGVGFSVQKQHVANLPAIGEPNEHEVLIHHPKDTITGWADTIGLLFESYSRGKYFEPCYDLIRPVGAELKTGGGRAPGHLPLKTLVERIRAILDEAIGRRLRPIECHDIICFIAESVLAGGIRRSSLISLFSKDDDEMLNCKSNEHFNYNGLNSQRAMANNSVVFLRDQTTRQEFLELMNKNRHSYGEPGFMFTNNLDHGTNPCGEIGIDPIATKVISIDLETSEADDWEDETGFGFCNLCEINVAACDSEQEFFDAAKAAAFIGTLQAAYTDFPYLTEATEQIAKRDALLGVGLVGIMDKPTIGLSSTTLKIAAQKVKDENERVSKLIGINVAARCTTVKPSGTSSLELGCVGSGIHPHHSPRYFRRVTANRNEPVAQYFAAMNPHMVEHKLDGDLCITFPVEAPSGSVTLGAIQPLEFMDFIFKVYDSWIFGGMKHGMSEDELTHNISSTVVVAEDEWDSVLNYAWANRQRIRSMSFFPKFADKEIPYAPREEVTDLDITKYRSLIKNYKPVDYLKMIEERDHTSLANEPACSGGACDLVYVDSLPVADGHMFFTDKPLDIDENWIFKYPTMDFRGIPVYKGLFFKLSTRGSV